MTFWFPRKERVRRELPSPVTLASLVRSVAVLALPAAGQCAWLTSTSAPAMTLSVDELALEFDDGYRMGLQFVQAGWITEATLEAMDQLDDLLSAMSGEPNASLWDEQALGSSPKWDEVRSLARAVLLSI